MKALARKNRLVATVLVLTGSLWGNGTIASVNEVTQDDLIEALTGSPSPTVSEMWEMDLNRDGRLDVADLVTYVNADNQVDDALAAYEWCEGETAKTQEDAQQFLDDYQAENPDGLDELAVYLAARAEMGENAIEGGLSISDLLSRLETTWPTEWDREDYQTEIAYFAMDGSITLQIEAVKNVNPIAFAAIMSSRFGLSDELPSGVFLNQYLQALQYHLSLYLLPSMSWHEAWLLGTVQHVLPYPQQTESAERLRSHVIASLIENGYLARRYVSDTGQQLVQMMLDEIGPPATLLIPEFFRVDGQVHEPRKILASILRTRYLTQDEIDQAVSALNLDEEMAKKLALGQVEILLLYRAMEDLGYFLPAPPDFEGASRSLVEMYVPDPDEQDGYLQMLKTMYGAAEVAVDPATPVLTSPPPDTLVGEVILKAFQYLLTADRTQFHLGDAKAKIPGNAGDLLQDTAVGLATLYVKVHGNALSVTPELVGIDDVVEMHADDPNYEDWEAWGDGFNLYRGSVDMYQLLCGAAKPAGVVQLPSASVELNSPYVLSFSKLGDEELAISAGMRRMLDLTTAMFLYHQAAAYHQEYTASIVQNKSAKSIAKGLPPSPNQSMFENVVRRYIIATELLRRAWPESGWEESSECLALGPVFSFAELEANRLFSDMRRALCSAAQGKDFWGLGARPFSMLGIDRQMQILNGVIDIVKKIEENESDLIDHQFQTDILKETVARQEDILQAREHETAAAQHHAQAARYQLEEATREYDLQDDLIAISMLRMDEAEFMADAAEYAKYASDDSQEAQAIKKQIIDRQVARLAAQVQFLEEQAADARAKVEAAKTSLESGIELATEKLPAKYEELRKKAILEAPCTLQYKEEYCSGEFMGYCHAHSERVILDIAGLRRLGYTVYTEGRQAIVTGIPLKDCQARGGIKHLGKTVDEIAAKIREMEASSGCQYPGVFGSFRCEAGDFWEENKEIIIKVGDMVAIAYTGQPLVSYAVAAADFIEGVSSGDEGKMLDGVTRAAGALLSDKVAMGEISDALKDTCLAEVLGAGDLEKFMGRADEISKFIESGALSDPSKMKEFAKEQFWKFVGDEFEITSDELDEWASDALRETIAEPIRDLGTTFLTNREEFLGMLKEEVGYDSGPRGLQQGVEDIINDVQGQIDEEIANLPPPLGDLIDQVEYYNGKIEDLIDGGTVPVGAFIEDQIIGAAVDSAMANKEVNQALKTIQDLYERVVRNPDIVREIENLPGFPPGMKGRIPDILQWYGEKRVEELGNFKAAESVSQTAQDAVRAVDPELINRFLETIRSMRTDQAYLADQKTHETTIAKAVVLPLSPPAGQPTYENIRDQHVAKVTEVVTRLYEKTLEAKANLDQIEQALAVKRIELEDAQDQSRIEEALLSAARNTVEERKSELKAAMVRVTTASKEIEVAKKRKEIFQVAVERFREKLLAAEEELEAARMRQEAAECDVSIAVLQSDRHERLATQTFTSLYWRNQMKEMAYQLARRSIFDFARTFDHVNGTNLLDHLRGQVLASSRDLALTMYRLQLLMYNWETSSNVRFAGGMSPLPLLQFDLGSDDLEKALVLKEAALSYIGNDNYIYEPAANQPLTGGRLFVWQVETYHRTEGGHPSLEDNTYIRSPESLFAEVEPIRVAYESTVTRPTYSKIKLKQLAGTKADAKGSEKALDYIRLLHLGDMWFLHEPIQNTAVAPVLYDASFGWALPAIQHITRFLTNNQYFIEVQFADGAELEAENFYGANYPLFGTWWVILAEEDIPPGEWDFQFTLYGTGIIPGPTENYKSFLNAPPPEGWRKSE